MKLSAEQLQEFHERAMDYRGALDARSAWIELVAHVESLCSAAYRAGMEQAAGIADAHASCEGIAQSIASEIRQAHHD